MQWQTDNLRDIILCNLIFYMICLYRKHFRQLFGNRTVHSQDPQTRGRSAFEQEHLWYGNGGHHDFVHDTHRHILPFRHRSVDSPNNAKLLRGPVPIFRIIYSKIRINLKLIRKHLEIDRPTYRTFARLSLRGKGNGRFYGRKWLYVNI